MITTTRIRKLRSMAGISASELSRRAKVDRSRLSLAEGGVCQLNKGQVDALRRALIEAIHAKILGLKGAISRLAEN
jgi:transcriptional regulator with XRE-family HTH domain